MTETPGLKTTTGAPGAASNRSDFALAGAAGDFHGRVSGAGGLGVGFPAGHANAVAADMVDNVENISEVYSTSGQYDLLAKFQLPKEMDIGAFVTKSVQTTPHIRDTFTVITFSPFLPSGR